MNASCDLLAAEPSARPAAAFALLLPRIRAHVAYALRHVAGPDARDELAAETVALAWKHFAALAARGKHPEEFASTLARRCAQAARAGRRLAGGDTEPR